MDWSNSVWTAVALVLLFEGLLPFVSPSGWRRMFLQLTQLRDGQIRFIALISIVLGASMLALA
jgi:uncharacterized protein YjeT (DUF2065 family)